MSVAGRALLLAVLLAAPGFGQAIGLGKLRVNSNLDQPLRAQIELLAVESVERGSLSVKLASAEAFAGAGVDRLRQLEELKFTIKRPRRGRAVLEVSTDKAVAEPFLHFLVQLEWAGGRLVREYTALLDPPVYARGRPAAVTSPVISADVRDGTLGPPDVSEGRSPVYGTGADSPVSTPGPPVIPADRSPVFEPGTEPGGPSRGEDTRRTVRGDTLWDIATDIKSTIGLSEFRIMLALLRANPAAFVANNINRLKSGYILRLPDREQVRTVSANEASARYTEQLAEWQDYKTRLAARSRGIKTPPVQTAARPGRQDSSQQASGQTPAPPPKVESVPKPEPKPVPEPETTRAAGQPAAAKAPVVDSPVAGKPSKTPTAAKPAEPTGSEPKTQTDLLRIVRATLEDDAKEAQASPGGSGSSDKEQAALREQITILEEALVSEEMGNTELKERVRLLEDQVANAARLIELESAPLALAQNRQQAAKTAPAPGAAAEPGTRVETPAVVKPVDKPTVKKPVVKTAAVGKPAAKTPTVRKPVVTSPPVKPRRVVSRRVEEDGFLTDLVDTVAGNWMSTVAMGVAIILLGAAGLWIFRRRRSIAEFEESILSGSALDSQQSSDSTDSVQGHLGADSSFLSDLGAPGMGSMHADEVDPIAEAEVYLAYGRSEQAEEVLKEAVNKDPERAELKLKLLEIYENREDVNAFETLAEEMYPAQGAEGGEVWAQVVAMGQKLNADNPLFKNASGGGVAEAPEPEGGARRDDESILEPFPAPEPEPGLDLDLDDFATPPEKAPQDGGSLDLDALVQDTAAGSEPPVESSAPAVTDTVTMEVAELDTDRVAAPVEVDSEPPPAAQVPTGVDYEHDTPTASVEPGTLEGLDLEMPAQPQEPAAPPPADTDAGEPMQWDETATKLDLAKAYIDMGDESGARNILDEVLAEGNEMQRQQATDLAGQLGAAP